MYEQPTATILAGDGNWQLEDLNYFLKCGEITASPDMQCFGLNCRFCSGICLQFEVFMQHLREQHSKDIFAMYSLPNVELMTGGSKDGENENKIDETTENNLLDLLQLDKLCSSDIETHKDTNHLNLCGATSNANSSDFHASTLTVISSPSIGLSDYDMIENYETKTKHSIFAKNEPLTEQTEDKHDNDKKLKQFNCSQNKQQQNHALSIDTGRNEKILQNRDVLSFLLEAFKSESALWDPNNIDYKTCNRLKVYDSIAQQLKTEIGVSLSGQACYLEIQKLCTRYRKELRLENKHKGVNLPKIWCFQKLEFLRDIYEHQLTKRIEKLNGIVVCKPNKTTILKSSAIHFNNDEEQLQFIELYKNQQTLWNADHPDFRSTTFRNAALKQLLREFNEQFGENKTIEELQKTIFKFRKDFSARKQKQLTENFINITKNEDRHALEFLEPYVGPFRCEICAKLVKTIDQYKIHKSQHDGTMPFLCPLCGKGFKMPSNFKVHLRRHKQDFPYACNNCHKSFATSTEAIIHRRTHTGERPYVCEICRKSFKTWSFFDIHRRTHLQQSTFHCPICDKGFYEKNRYTDHMNIHLHIRKHQCTQCNKNFTTCANLKKHLELHLPIKKYKCSVCNKRFAQFASLRWHKTKKHAADEQIIES